METDIFGKPKRFNGGAGDPRRDPHGNIITRVSRANNNQYSAYALKKTPRDNLQQDLYFQVEDARKRKKQKELEEKEREIREDERIRREQMEMAIKYEAEIARERNAGNMVLPKLKDKMQNAMAPPPPQPIRGEKLTSARANPPKALDFNPGWHHKTPPGKRRVAEARAERQAREERQNRETAPHRNTDVHGYRNNIPTLPIGEMYGNNSHSPQIRHPYSNRSTTIQESAPPIINDNHNPYSSSLIQRPSASNLHQMYSPPQAPTNAPAVNHAAIEFSKIQLQQQQQAATTEIIKQMEIIRMQFQSQTEGLKQQLRANNAQIQTLSAQMQLNRNSISVGNNGKYRPSSRGTPTRMSIQNDPRLQELQDDVTFYEKEMNYWKEEAEAWKMTADKLSIKLDEFKKENEKLKSEMVEGKSRKSDPGREIHPSYGGERDYDRHHHHQQRQQHGDSSSIRRDPHNIGGNTHSSTRSMGRHSAASISDNRRKLNHITSSNNTQTMTNENHRVSHHHHHQHHENHNHNIRLDERPIRPLQENINFEDIEDDYYLNASPSRLPRPPSSSSNQTRPHANERPSSSTRRKMRNTSIPDESRYEDERPIRPVKEKIKNQRHIQTEQEELHNQNLQNTQKRGQREEENLIFEINDESESIFEDIRESEDENENTFSQKNNNCKMNQRIPQTSLSVEYLKDKNKRHHLKTSHSTQSILREKLEKEREMQKMKQNLSLSKEVEDISIMISPNFKQGYADMHARTSNKDKNILIDEPELEEDSVQLSVESFTPIEVDQCEFSESKIDDGLLFGELLTLEGGDMEEMGLPAIENDLKSTKKYSKMSLSIEDIQAKSSIAQILRKVSDEVNEESKFA